MTWLLPGLTTPSVNKVALHTAVIYFIVMTVYSPSAMEVGEVVPFKKNYLAQKGVGFFFCPGIGYEPVVIFICFGKEF